MYCEPENPTDPREQWEPAPWLRRALLLSFPQARTHAQERGIHVHFLVNGLVEARNVAATIRIDIAPLYTRSLAKIAFHYALMVDPNISGREQEFDPIRNFIVSGGNPEPFVDLNAEPFVIQPRVAVGRRVHRTAMNGIQHFLFARVNVFGDLVVRMHFFAGGSHLSGAPEVFGIPPVRVRIGPYPNTLQPRTAHALRLFTPPVNGFDGEVLRLELAQVDGIWGAIPPPWRGRTAGM
jgi:hypothetical protein